MFEETIYLPNYINSLFGGERLYIGTWLIPSVYTKTLRNLLRFSKYFNNNIMGDKLLLNFGAKFQR